MSLEVVFFLGGTSGEKLGVTRLSAADLHAIL